VDFGLSDGLTVGVRVFNLELERDRGHA